MEEIKMFEIEVTNYVYVPIEEIIEAYNLTSHSTKREVLKALEDYVCGCDDSEYYLWDEVVTEKAYNEIRRVLGEQLSLPL